MRSAAVLPYNMSDYPSAHQERRLLHRSPGSSRSQLEAKLEAVKLFDSLKGTYGSGSPHTMKGAFAPRVSRPPSAALLAQSAARVQSNSQQQQQQRPATAMGRSTGRRAAATP